MGLTGLSPRSGTAAENLCRNRCGIKAAGGIHSLELVVALVEAGADLIGTSSAPQLVQALRRPAG